MMCVHLLSQGFHRGSRKKKEPERAPKSFGSSLQSRDIFVRIVHAGGQEELYQYAILASQLIEKYPGKCVARPEVFRKPLESLLQPDEKLLPGHKYLMIPSTTARKLRHRYMEKVKFKEFSAGIDELSDVNVTWDASGDTDESVCSANEFYISKEKVSEKEFYVSKEKGSKAATKMSIRAKRPFVPPLPKSRSFRGPGWEPSLTSVQELSP